MDSSTSRMTTTRRASGFLGWALLATITAACQSSSGSDAVVEMRAGSPEATLDVVNANLDPAAVGDEAPRVNHRVKADDEGLTRFLDRRTLKLLQYNGAFPSPQRVWQTMQKWEAEEGSTIPARVLRGACWRIAQERELSLAERLSAIRRAIERYRWTHDGELPSEHLVEDLTDSRDGRRLLPFGLVGNPIRGTGSDPAAVQVVSRMPRTCSGKVGWIYAVENGEFRANSKGIGPSGIAYFDL